MSDQHTHPEATASAANTAPTTSATQNPAPNADASFDPAKERLVQTRDGVVTIPREQQGVPLKDYFKNAELPPEIDRAVVYATSSGPVLSPPDPVPWNEQHNEQARSYAGKIKTLIEEKGYYSKALNAYADRLSDQTGRSREETKAIIVKSFENAQGTDPFRYLQDQRAAQGIPVRDRQQDQQQGQHYDDGPTPL
ncbi:MAG: hypothetical protein AAGF28_12595 [Pseudomonadota bacterium]